MTVLEIIGTIGGSGLLIVLMSLIKVKPLEISVWHFLARKIGKAFNGELFDKIDEIDKGLNQHVEKHELEKADTNRQRILRFSDEMYDKKYHSKESFEDILDKIEEYNSYCESHPDYKNQRTVIATKVIKDQYEECLKNHTFKTSPGDDNPDVISEE